MKLVIVVSTGGSVMNELLRNSFFKSRVHSVVSDRECSGIDKARNHHVETVIILERSKETFSSRLLEYLKCNDIDYVISFFTKLYVGRLLTEYSDRILNLHLSLLPSFKGFNAFRSATEYGVRYLGSTIHFIDEDIDEGKIIIQTVFPLDVNKDKRLLRHKLFEQQCKSLLQVVKWLDDNRIEVVGNKVQVRDAVFTDFEFSPTLDFDDAVSLEIPFEDNAG